MRAGFIMGWGAFCVFVLESLVGGFCFALILFLLLGLGARTIFSLLFSKRCFHSRQGINIDACIALNTDCSRCNARFNQ